MSYTPRFGPGGDHGVASSGAAGWRPVTALALVPWDYGTCGRSSRSRNERAGHPERATVSGAAGGRAARPARTRLAPARRVREQPAGTLDVGPEMLGAAARALGYLSRSEPPTVLSRRWPACVGVAVAQVTACHDRNGKVWPAWHRATGSRATCPGTGDRHGGRARCLRDRARSAAARW